MCRSVGRCMPGNVCWATRLGRSVALFDPPVVAGSMHVAQWMLVWIVFARWKQKMQPRKVSDLSGPGLSKSLTAWSLAAPHQRNSNSAPQSDKH